MTESGWWKDRLRALPKYEQHTDTSEPVGDPVDAGSPDSIPDAAPLEPAVSQSSSGSDDPGAVDTTSAEEAPADSDGSPPATIIEPSKLEDAFKWAAAGFTALAAVLTFFGIKEGTLDQALRLYPVATMCIFIFLGIGVVSALFAPAIDPNSRLRTWVVFAGLITMLLSAAAFFPNIGERQSQELERAGTDDPGWLDVSNMLRIVLLVVALGLALYLAWIRSARGESFTSSRMLLCLGSLGAVLAIVLFLSLPREIDPVSGESNGIDSTQILTGVLAFLLVLALLAMMVWAFVSRQVMPTMAGLVILAVAATSLGLYGATKIAVESKSLAVLPQVTATIEDGTNGQTLAVSVTAGHLRGQRLIMEVLGIPRDQGPRALEEPTTPTTDSRRIWGVVLQPDALDDLDQSLKIPIVATRWKTLSVRYCSVGDDYKGPTNCAKEAMPSVDDETSMDAKGPVTYVVSIRSRAPEPHLSQVNAEISPAEGDNLTATFRAIDVSPGTLVKVELCRTHKGKHTQHVADATLSPDSEGKVSWEATVPAGIAKDRLVLRHTTCPPGSPCSAAWMTLATYMKEPGVGAPRRTNP